MTKQKEEEFEKPSKSQKKREMSELLSIVKELEALSLKELEVSLDQRLKQKIIELQRIKKGSAKKRQRQHIVKFLSKQDFLFATEDLARLKNSKTAKNQSFREIEILRERLLSNQEEAFESLKDSCPNIDMRKMRTLINLAQQEDEAGSRRNYRELFKVLRNAKELSAKTG
ncbi:MAG: ribosome biogenesis factor YjgA [Pseudomonadota bacterium]|nr:ribosome biogenesis factor YjgA [Pseudomonadota bacterium]